MLRVAVALAALAALAVSRSVPNDDKVQVYILMGYVGRACPLIPLQQKKKKKEKRKKEKKRGIKKKKRTKKKETLMENSKGEDGREFE